MEENGIAGTSPNSVSEEGRVARTGNGRRRAMGIRGRGWRTLAGKCVLALSVGVGVVGCSFGGFDLSELQPGECITGNVEFYPPRSIEVIDCAEAAPFADYKVVFTESATGDFYPGNLDEINVRCQSEGGRILTPSDSTWDDGDRVALCYQNPDIPSW
ncbi:MAG: hypothetical protein ACR2N0_08675 [Rubrobacteraceae bacterium]|jgi:hypothetical protein|nr:hypothetical protein [Rubrobacter sp.]